jgi:uncharacterized protein (DUF488 family)
MNDRAHAFFTIGHSTRPIDEFIALLREAEVELVIDVRAIPRSRRNPQYNQETLPSVLAASGFGYEHLAALGGRRGRQRHVLPATNGFWTHPSFHQYADYAMGDQFRAGLAKLRQLGRARQSAIMCAEAVWWRCHRRIITDYLLAAGERVMHVMGPGVIVPAQMTPAARVDASGALSYPAAQGSLL